MKVNEKQYQTIWLKEGDNSVVQIIDQRFLPFKFVIRDLKSFDEVLSAIKEMQVRGAPLVGVTAAFGMYVATLHYSPSVPFGEYISKSVQKLQSTRPTAINLGYAVNKQLSAINSVNSLEDKIKIALKTALQISDEEKEYCRKIGIAGLPLIEEISDKKKGESVNILTHCNAGWLACIDFGTATAPIYLAHDKGIKIHIWVDETRPRNQGARLTAWELEQHGVPHTVIPDNTGGHLMQRGMVDLVLVGSDRTTLTGDVVNKIGTYLKALAANDNHVPFYVALPSSSIDWNITNSIKQIPIEQRNPDEVKYIEGYLNDKIEKIRLTPENSPAANYGFDITPARLVTGLITERGICKANKGSILNLFPEKVK